VLTCYERIHHGLKELPNQDEWERKTEESILKEMALMDKVAMAMPEPRRTQLLLKIESFRRDFFKKEKREEELTRE